MQTLYIDVYFLVNFTVDILSLYFAALFSKVRTSVKRLLLSSVLGAVISVLIIILPEWLLLKLSVIVLGTILIGFVGIMPVSLVRHFKFTVSFFIFESLVGGITYMLYGLLDSILGKSGIEGEGGSENQRLLLFALIVLLSIGVFKIIISFFSGTFCERSIEVEIRVLDKEILFEAFIDSGNLAVDPMDMQPVLFIKEELARKLFPGSLINFSTSDLLEDGLRRRIRLIPITNDGSTRLLVGVKPDCVKVKNGKGSEEISVTLAIDKEGGNYGGFYALMPSAALSNVLT